MQIEWGKEFIRQLVEKHNTISGDNSAVEITWDQDDKLSDRYQWRLTIIRGGIPLILIFAAEDLADLQNTPEIRSFFVKNLERFLRPQASGSLFTFPRKVT